MEARKAKGLLTYSEQKMIEEMVKEPFDPECFVDTQFKNFKIQDLKDH